MGVSAKIKKCYLSLCMANFVGYERRSDCPWEEKKNPLWSSNHRKCTWYVRQGNTAQCYEHFPAALVTGAV